MKHTPESLVASAKKYQTKSEWRRHDNGAYNAAITKPEVWEKCTAHMGVVRSNQNAAADTRAKIAAASYKTKKEWRLSDSETYRRALRWRRRRPADWAACTAHMKIIRARRPNESYCKVRYTDDIIRASALLFKTKSDWDRGDSPCYNAACARRKTRPEFWTQVTAHMVPASYGPYLGSYYVYGCLFWASKACYIGISCRAEHKRLNEHISTGKVARYAEKTRQPFTWVVLKRGIADPVAAGTAELRWHDSYVADGWTMLSSRERCGNLGLTLGRKNKNKTNRIKVT